MTLAELHERIGWQLEGRLQGRYAGDWIDWGLDKTAPTINCPASSYRRRPDPPPMPDEVWIAHYPSQFPPSEAPGNYFRHRDECVGYNKGAIPIRFVRAGMVIPVNQIEWRPAGSTYRWCLDAANEYRIKP